MNDYLTKSLMSQYSRMAWHAALQRDSKELPLDEKKKITAYLESPVAYGLWQLSTTWLPEGGISGAIWSAIKSEIDGKDSIEIRSGKRARQIKVTENWQHELQTDVCYRLTVLFGIFSYLCAQDRHEAEEEPQYGIDHEAIQLALDMIDISAIKLQFSEALAFFKDHLWYDGFQPVTHRNKPTQLQNGFFILTKAPVDNGSNLLVVSWEGAPLQALMKFLILIGKVDAPSLMPVFSPEEEVFAPYFDLLSLAHDYVVPQEHLQPFIRKAITNFNEKNFTDSVSAIGLAAEDVLTQIYETLYRQQLTKGLTLGQLADQLHTRAAARFRKKEAPTPELATLFPEIKAALDDPTLSSTQSVELLRKFLALTIEFNKHTLTKIEKIGKQEKRCLVYPEHVDHAVNELIRYRNAASHKSRVPIGPIECIRSAHSFIVLVTWWFREKTVIDWSKSPDDIVKECIERNTSH